MLELFCEIPLYVYEYADERGNLFHVVKKARPKDDIPNTVLARRGFIHMEEKVIYYDVMGNDYELAPHSYHHTVESRKGRVPSLTSSRLSPRVPPSFEHLATKSSSVILQTQHVNVNSQELREWKLSCEECGIEHITKDCPFYKPPKPHALQPLITQSIANRDNQLIKHSHIKITLVTERTIMFVSANLNSKRNQSVLSYKVWEALGKLTLTPLEPQDKKCIGCIILNLI